jgi:hypothetical protein
MLLVEYKWCRRKIFFPFMQERNSLMSQDHKTNWVFFQSLSAHKLTIQHILCFSKDWINNLCQRSILGFANSQITLSFNSYNCSRFPIHISNHKTTKDSMLAQNYVTQEVHKSVNRMLQEFPACYGNQEVTGTFTALMESTRQ